MNKISYTPSNAQVRTIMIAYRAGKTVEQISRLVLLGRHVVAATIIQQLKE